MRTIRELMAVSEENNIASYIVVDSIQHFRNTVSQILSKLQVPTDGFRSTVTPCQGAVAARYSTSYSSMNR